MGTSDSQATELLPLVGLSLTQLVPHVFAVLQRALAAFVIAGPSEAIDDIVESHALVHRLCSALPHQDSPSFALCTKSAVAEYRPNCDLVGMGPRPLTCRASLEFACLMWARGGPWQVEGYSR